MITVFFDGSCGLCAREISFYRRLDRDHAIKWIDISQDQTVLARYGVSWQDAMYELHCLNQAGRVIKGVDSFILIWANVPTLKGLARLGQVRLVYELLKKAYGLFIKWRARKGIQCPTSRGS